MFAASTPEFLHFGVGVRKVRLDYIDVSHKESLVTEEHAEGFGERERRILEFERYWWKYAGAKERAIRESFDLSATRYYQLLNRIIDMPEALSHDPILVKRLQRLRAFRQQQRMARRLGIRLSEK